MASSLQTKLIFWTEWHALWMIAGALLVWYQGLPFMAAVFAGFSFLSLIFRCRFQWTAKGVFGWPNRVTLLRLGGVLGLLFFPKIHPSSMILFAALLFSLDGLDGWLARKGGLASEFGEYFDKEVDAFFLLTLCLLLYDGGRLGGWILLPGLLRYFFVLFLKFANPPQVKEQQSSRGKWIYFLMMAALIFCFTPFPPVYKPFAAIMTGILGYSFLDALYRLYRLPSADPGA